VVATQTFLEVSPRKIGEDFQFDEYFSDGLKPPTRYLFIPNLAIYVVFKQLSALVRPTS